MATIVLRSVKGSPLTIEEADANFTNINTEVGTKLDTSAFTASAILTKLSDDDDGTGKNLNATTLGGQTVSNAGGVSSIVASDSSGNITATTFVGNLDGDVTGNLVGDVTGDVTGTATNVSGVVAIQNGGTGATTINGVKTALGVGTLAEQDADNVAITGGSIELDDPLPISSGGTGGIDANAARTALGLVIGQDVQPFSNTLTAFGGVTGTGIFVKTGTGTAATRSITASTNISVTDGDGVSGNIAISGTETPTVSSITKTGTSGTGDIGQSGNKFGTIYGTATSAQYADLAEKYLADEDYEVGTVVKVGGSKEITACNVGCRVLGVISDNPAFRMNEDLEGGIFVALKGRVPVKVVGMIKKGDELVATENGHAYAPSSDTTGLKVFGIALEDKNDALSGTIEAVIL